MHHAHQGRHWGPCTHGVDRVCVHHAPCLPAVVMSACTQAEGLAADPALSPGGPFDGRPGDFALSKLNFYQCSRVGCQRVYYGGRKECRAQAAEGQQAVELRCLAQRANCKGPCCTCLPFVSAAMLGASV